MSTFTVINTASDPSTSGSLPWAVQQANSTPGTNTIDFNIPGSGTQIININSPLSLTSPVTIDGTSQPGYTATPLISVQGNANVQRLFELGFGSSGSTIQGLDMYDYTYEAVGIFTGSTGNFIQNNWIGFFRDPTTGQVHLNYNLGSNFNQTAGIGVLASNNNVLRNNVIDGTGTGIGVGGNGGTPGMPPVTPALNNSIVGNFIGTDPSGATAVGYGNQKDGIYLGLACEYTVIAGNVISGNAANGIEMQLNYLGRRLVFPGYNVVSSNKIGTDVSGSFAIPNGSYGVALLSGSSYNSILQNTFGPNGIGSVYVEPGTNWNSIGYTPQVTPSSFAAQIQIIVDYYVLMLQQLVSNNPSGFFDALHNCVYFAGIVQAEIINTLLRM